MRVTKVTSTTGKYFLFLTLRQRITTLYIHLIHGHRTYKTELMNLKVKKTIADKCKNKLSVTIFYFRKKKKLSIFPDHK